MLLVSKRYYNFWLKHLLSTQPLWMDQVYYHLLDLKRFWKTQGINRN